MAVWLSWGDLGFVIMELFFYIVAFLCGVWISSLFLSKRSDSANQRDIKELIEFKKITISSGDVLVIRYNRDLGIDFASSIREQMKWVTHAGVRVLIIDRFTDIYAVIKSQSLDVKEGNTDANNSNKDTPNPFPLSEVKLNDDASK